MKEMKWKWEMKMTYQKYSRNINEEMKKAEEEMKRRPAERRKRNQSAVEK